MFLQRFINLLKEIILKSKIQTYLGFAKKSNAIVYGLDNLEKYFKKNCLVLYSNNLSENSLNKLSRLVAERKWKMGVLKNQTIDELLFVDNCKILS